MTGIFNKAPELPLTHTEGVPQKFVRRDIKSF